MKDQYRINEQIIGVEQVRLVGDNITPGVYSFKEAYQLADDLNLDLVEISSTQNPVICKIFDYEKFIYNQKRNENKQKAPEIKEIRFSPQTDDHDLEFKIKHAINFLQSKHKVRAYVIYRGREIFHKEQGETLLLKFCNALLEYGKIDKMPILEDKKLTVLINPK